MFQAVGVLSFARNKWVKAVVFGAFAVILVVSMSLSPAATPAVYAGTPGKCFFGKGYANVTNPEGNHNYVWFSTGTSYNGHASWGIYPPPGNRYFMLVSYSMNSVPSSGLAKVYFRFRWLPYWVLPKANTWMICAR